MILIYYTIAKCEMQGVVTALFVMVYLFVAADYVPPNYHEINGNHN